MTSYFINFINDISKIRPIQAWRAIRALIANPEDTGEVFKIVEALKGNGLARALERMQVDPQGRELLRRKPQILPVLSDRNALRAMPAGSLGRAYLDFVETQYLSADGLVAASEEVPRRHPRSADEMWLGSRLRDIHDLQHVLCGYGRDPLGELCLLGFMNAQTPNRGIAFIISMGRRQFRKVAPQIPIDACVAEGRGIGSAAKWFATVDWEQRMAEPLQTLRAQLGITAPRLYRESVDAHTSAEALAG